MTYHLSGGSVRPSLYSNANLLEKNLFLFYIAFRFIANAFILVIKTAQF